MIFKYIQALFNPDYYFAKPYIIPHFAVAIAIFILGIFIFFKNRKSASNIYFTFCCYSSAIWIFFHALCQISNSKVLAIFWAKVAYIGVTFIATNIYAFSVFYLNFWRQKRFVIFAFFTSTVFCLLSQTDLIIRTAKKFDWGYYPLAGDLHPAFLSFFFAMMLAGLYNFYVGYKQETLHIEKERRRLLFLAFFIAYFGSVDYLPNYQIPVYPFGYLPVFLLFFLITYSIVKYRLMDVETIVHKIIVYALLSSMVFILYAGMLLLVRFFIADRIVSLQEIITTSIFITIVLFFMSHLKDKTQVLIDKIFYRDKYNYRKTLEIFAKKLNLLLDSPDLLRTITTTVAEIIHIDKIALILFDEKTNFYTIRESKGLSQNSIGFEKNDPFLLFLQYYGNIVEKELLILDLDFKFKEMRADGLLLMKTLEAEIVIPLIVQRKLIGILTLGKKLSGEGYKIEDVDLLKGAGHEISIAVNNYLLYEGLEKTNKELQEAQAQLIQSAKMAAVGQLGAGVAHELNNPLGGILGYAQFMLEKINRENFGANEFQACRGYIESIERESIRCKKIVSNLLKFSRKPPTDKHELIEIGPAIEETLSFLTHQLKLRNVIVTVKIQPGLNKVMGVVNPLQQVFANLILNAQQAMPDGGELKITAENILDEDTNKSSQVKIEFNDTGCGIPEENLSRIFVPFFTTKTEKGTGLGLSISYQIIHDHKGKIEVLSQVGKGTTFTIILPTN